MAGKGIKEVGHIDLPVPSTWSRAEKRVLAIFGTVALAWIFRPFWTAWIGVSTISDSTIAVAGVAAMFLPIVITTMATLMPRVITTSCWIGKQLTIYRGACCYCLLAVFVLLRRLWHLG